MNGANESGDNPSGVQGICPAGWHIPSKSEFAELLDNFFNNDDALTALLDGGSSGFNALLGGTNGQITAQMEGEDLGMIGKYWSTTKFDSGFENFYVTLVFEPDDPLYPLNIDNGSLNTTTWSCRCVKD